MTEPPAYRARHALLYDLFYEGKPYEHEAAFVAERLREAGIGKAARVLELACGTGRHAVALAGHGYRVVATDNSPDMLEVARTRVQDTGGDVELALQDMRLLDLKTPPFDASVSFFDSIGYVVTNEALEQTLAAVHRHVRPGGLFVFEFWHAPPMLRAFEPVRVRRFQVPEGTVLRISETSVEPQSQTARVSYTVLELARDGTYQAFEETQINRYFLVQEMAGLLSRAGFIDTRFFAGYDERAPIDAETWHVVAVGRRA